VKQVKDRNNAKKDQQIEEMSNELIVNELKDKRLDTFGTMQQRKDRLKRHYGKKGFI
jgi:hypothetical protein